MELAINQACRLSKAGSNDFDRPKKKASTARGRVQRKAHELSQKFGNAFAQLFRYVRKSAGADEECVEKRHKTLGGVLFPPPGEL